MIDDLSRAMALIVAMEESLPVTVALTAQLQRTLMAGSPQLPIPERCRVTRVLCLGDEGGIACELDIGGADAKALHLVSLTHLRLDRRSPLFRDIDAHQRRRIKKLERQDT